MIEPLIVTARLDAESFAALDGLRRRYFPAHLNKVPAHVSLFHRLPGDEVEAVRATVADCCQARSPLDIGPARVRFLGRGVALAYRSTDLSRLHAELAEAWRPWLTAQDRQAFEAHVTIQNKVEPAVARELAAALGPEPLPSCRVDGVTIWRYLGGPWQQIETCEFGAGS